MPSLSCKSDEISRVLCEDVINADVNQPFTWPDCRSFEAAIDDRQEGLVLKQAMASYGLDERSDRWVKLKPEYHDALADSIDCIILGGYYSKGVVRHISAQRLHKHLTTTCRGAQERCHTFCWGSRIGSPMKARRPSMEASLDSLKYSAKLAAVTTIENYGRFKTC